MSREIKEQSSEIVKKAHEKVMELLVEVEIVRGRMSIGAATVLHQALRNSLVCGPHTNLYLAVLAAFLQHPMNGGLLTLRDQKGRLEVERLAERLLLLPEDPDPRVGAEDID
jgi:hypothetical protein